MQLRAWFLVLVAVACPSVTSAADVGYTYDSFSRSYARFGVPIGPWEAMGTSPSNDYLTSLTVSSDEEFFGLGSEGRLLRVDPESGLTDQIGTITVPGGQNPTGLAFDANDRLLLLANAHPQSALYEIDRLTAEVTFLRWLNSDRLVTFAIHGASCYATDGWQLFDVDLSTGGVVELSEVFGWYYGGVSDLSFDSMGQLWAIEHRFSPVSGCLANYLVWFDLTSGDITRLKELPAEYYDECYNVLAIQPGDPIPVPTQGGAGFATLIAAIAGFGVALLVRKR